MRIREAADTFASLLAAHVEDLGARRWSVAAQRQARLILPRLFLHLGEHRISDPRGVTEEHLLRFMLKLQEDNLSTSSLCTYLGAIKRFFAFIEKRRLILVDPARELVLPKADRLPRRVLTQEEARRLMSAPFSDSIVGRRDRAILELLYGTGIRVGECLRLDLADLDLAQGLLLVRDGKGKKDRFVPVPGRAAFALDVYLRDSRPDMVLDLHEPALFLTKLGTRLGKSRFDLIVRKHALAARIARPVSPHVLRHTCATHLIQGGADVRHVQELLGHKSLQTTALYTRVAIEDLRAVIARAHPRERTRMKGRNRR